MTKRLFSYLCVLVLVTVSAVWGASVVETGRDFMFANQACVSSGGVLVGNNWSNVINAIQAGGIVRIAPGDYLSSEPVVVPSDTTITSQGCGRVTIESIGTHVFDIPDDAENIVIQGLDIRSTTPLDSVISIGENVLSLTVRYNNLRVQVTRGMIAQSGPGLDGLTITRNDFAKAAGGGSIIRLDNCNLSDFTDPGNVDCFNQVARITNPPQSVNISFNSFGFSQPLQSFVGDDMIHIDGIGANLIIDSNEFGLPHQGIAGMRSQVALTGIARLAGQPLFRQNIFHCEQFSFAGGLTSGPCVRVDLRSIDASANDLDTAPEVIFDRDIFLDPIIDAAVDANRSGNDATGAIADCDEPLDTCSRFGARSGALGLGSGPFSTGLARVSMFNVLVASETTPQDRLGTFDRVRALNMDHVTFIRSGFRAVTTDCPAALTYNIDNSIFSRSRILWELAGSSCSTPGRVDNNNDLQHAQVADTLSGGNHIFQAPNFIVGPTFFGDPGDLTDEEGQVIEDAPEFNGNLQAGSPGRGAASDGLDVGVFNRFNVTDALVVNDPGRVVLRSSNAAFPLGACVTGKMGISINSIPADIIDCVIDIDMLNVPWLSSQVIGVFIGQTIGVGDVVSVVLQDGAVQDDLLLGGVHGQHYLVARNWSLPGQVTANNQMTTGSGLPSVSFTHPTWSVSEETEPLGVCIMIDPPPTEPILVSLLRSGTADFRDVDVPASISIPQGATQIEAILTFNDDLIFEGTETLTLRLGANPAFSIGSQSSHVIIVLDNELAPLPPEPEPSTDFMVVRGATLSNTTLRTQ